MLRIKPALQFASRQNPQFEPVELHWVFHAGLEFRRDERDAPAFARPAAAREFVERAIGEHVVEAAVRQQTEFRADLHHAVEMIVAGERRVGRRAIGGAGGGNPWERQDRERYREHQDEGGVGAKARHVFSGGSGQRGLWAAIRLTERARRPRLGASSCHPYETSAAWWLSQLPFETY